MKINFIGRHFISGEDTFAEFININEYLRAAKVISQEKGYEINFGLKLTVVEEKIGADLKERIKEEWRQLPEGLWILYDPKDRGAGTSYQQILFNPTFSVDGPSLVISGDLDQYIIDSSEGLESILELAKKVETDGALYATGSRDVPVILAAHPRNSTLRIIHELFHSLTAGSTKLRINEQKSGVTPAYAEIGESTSGLYILNHAHPHFPHLLYSISQANQRANLKGFATDYYVAIKATQFSSIIKGYVRARENQFYTTKTEEVELKTIQQMITSQTVELSKTDVGELLRTSLNDKQNFELLARFYPREDIRYVRDLMLKAYGEN